MKKELFSLLGNVASVDFYFSDGTDISLISDNNAFNMTELAKEALQLQVPNTLTIVNLNNFYVTIIPIDKIRQLLIIPHINTTNIPRDYREIAKFVDNLNSLSSLAYQLFTNKKKPNWKTCVKKIPTAQKEVDFNSKIDLTAKFKNEQTIFKTIKNLNFNQFNKALDKLTLTQYMGTIFEQNNYARGEKDVMIRFVSLLMSNVIESGQVPIDVALKIQDDILGTIEFKKNIPPFEIWMKQVAIRCFKEIQKTKDESALLIPEKCSSYIKNHINQKLSLTILAQNLGCSKSSLAHSFKKKYNQTISSYINIQKVKAAQYMLINSSVNISEIAYTLAFNNPNYFMRIFKHYVGISPTAYRVNIRINSNIQ